MQTGSITERRQHILRIVVQEYVSTAQPVSSNSIANQHGLGVSAATIRNDLAALEQEGLLTHPHTSAGRIPTDAGYRFFVRHLLADAELPSAERKIIRMEFNQADQELDQWLRLSTAVLARASQSAALATAPRATQCRFKHMELVQIHDEKVLLVLVLEAGMVKQQVLDLDQPIAQTELSKISNQLNVELAGQDGIAIYTLHAGVKEAEELNSSDLLIRQIAVLIADVMERIDRQTGGQIYRDGLVQILEAPEFAFGENVRRIVRVFEQRSLLDQIVDEYGDEQDVQVVIAGNGRFSELEDISLIISSYGVSNHATGILGVVGPVRMPYGRTISAVRFVSSLMSELVGDIYGY